MNNNSIKGDCKMEKIDDEYVYNFTLKYLFFYSHNPDCVTQIVKFGTETLKEGDSNSFGVWKYDGNDTINFKVKHSSLVPNYGCKYESEISKFRWLC